MATVKKSITVTEQQEAWLQTQLASGNYASDSEIIREAIREKQARTDETERIRAALIEAEGRGFGGRSMEDIRQGVLAELRRNGELPDQ